MPTQNSHPADETESESFLNATPADALYTRPDTEQNMRIYEEGLSNLTRDSSPSYDRISDVMGVVTGVGTIQHSNSSNDLRIVQLRPIDHSRHSENENNREEHHTAPPNHSIRTPLSKSNGIYQDVSSTFVQSWRPWTPLFLQESTMLCMIAAYAFLMAALITLLIGDYMNQGLATVHSNIRYVWTYGPTAVLATLAGLWGQVEHRSKQMMPWAMLHNGPVSAADALLLNYIEPPQLVSLYTSIRKGHYPVTLAIVGSLLLQLLTVVSTGLFRLQIERTIHYGVAIQTTDAFNKGFQLDRNIEHPSIGDSPVLSTIALNNGNLSYPLGTSDRFTFSTIHVQDTFIEAKNTIIETTTEVFHAELDCEIVTDFHWNHGFLNRSSPEVTFTTPSCHVENLTIGFVSDALIQGAFCGSNSTKCDNSSSFPRFVIALGDYTAGMDGKITIDNTSLLMCQPRYDIEPWSLAFDGTGAFANEGEKSLLGPTNSSSLSLSQWDLMDAFLQSIENTASIVVGPMAYTRGFGNTLGSMDYFCNALVDFSMPPSIADLYDAKVLLNETTRFFSMASAQLAKSYLMMPSNKMIRGTVSTDEQRLRIRGLSLFLMIAILGFLIANAALLYSLCPRNTVSRDPGSVGGLAVLITDSPSFHDVLSGKSLWNKSRLHSYLSKYQALSVLQPSNGISEFRVVLARHSFPTNTLEKDDDQHGARWWQPVSTRPWAKAAIIVFLLSLIGGMEFSYQTSKRHDGLAKVEIKSYVRYTWAYVPAVAMLAAQLLVAMIGDWSRIVFPYHELRCKLNSTTENLFEDLLSKVTAHAVYRAIKLKQYALLATGLSMLLTPFLTIVSSGLFSPEPTTRTCDSILRIDNVLNTSMHLPSTMVKSDLAFQSEFNLQLILTSNLSYPEWTYRELAFHKMTIDTIKDTSNNLNALYPDLTGLMIQATVPAVRVTLDCIYFSPEHVYISYKDNETNDTEKPYHYTNITIYTIAAVQPSVPEGCCNHSIHQSLPGNFSSHVSAPFALFQSDGTNLLAAFGSSLRNGSAQILACVPIVEQVQTDTTFSLPSYRIVAATTNETTAVAIAKNTAAIEIDLILSSGPFSGDTSATNGGNYDETFTTLLGAPGIATLEAADFDAANAAHSKIADALQQIFRLAYVQVLNLVARSDVPANASNGTVASGNISMPTILEGQILDPQSQIRLKQSVVSTRILEGLLGTIVVCLLVSFWLLDTRKVMPENACSIAVAASLLAGADMLRGVPRGAVWWNDDEAVKKEVFGKNAVFSLGWWGTEERDGEMSEGEADTGAVVERDGSGEVRGMRRRRFGIDKGRASWD